MAEKGAGSGGDGGWCGGEVIDGAVVHTMDGDDDDLMRWRWEDCELELKSREEELSS